MCRRETDETKGQWKDIQNGTLLSEPKSLKKDVVVDDDDKL